MLGVGARPIAALSSGLLARKGHARPAMRPHGTDPHGTDPHGADPHGDVSADDLGWNDMGGLQAPVAPPDLPPVLVERAALSDEVTRIAPATPEPGPGPEAEPPAAVPATPAAGAIERIGGGRARPGAAAFTLRLPADRHLRLRLAAAVTHRSAQAIVTEALDAFLSTLPQVEELAHRCSAPGCPTPDRTGNRP